MRVLLQCVFLRRHLSLLVAALASPVFVSPSAAGPRWVWGDTIWASGGQGPEAGKSVALRDGMAVIGAPSQGRGTDRTGAVMVFDRKYGDRWSPSLNAQDVWRRRAETPTKFWQPSSLSNGARFGASVAAGPNRRIVIGAPGQEMPDYGFFGEAFDLSVSTSSSLYSGQIKFNREGTHKFAGAVFIYEWNGTDWEETRIFERTINGQDSNPVDNDNFGESVSTAGDFVAVGIPGDHHGVSAQILETIRSWAYLTSNPFEVQEFVENHLGEADGAIEIWQKRDSGGWHMVLHLSPETWGEGGGDRYYTDDWGTTHGAPPSRFGATVALSPNTHVLFVGAPGFTDGGRGYFFFSDPNATEGKTKWFGAHRTKVVSPAGTSARMGESAVWIDNNTIAVGAPGVGRILIYRVDAATKSVTLLQTLGNDGGGTGALGVSVAAWDNWLVAGAPSLKYREQAEPIEFTVPGSATLYRNYYGGIFTFRRGSNGSYAQFGQPIVHVATDYPEDDFGRSVAIDRGAVIGGAPGMGAALSASLRVRVTASVAGELATGNGREGNFIWITRQGQPVFRVLFPHWRPHFPGNPYQTASVPLRSSEFFLELEAHADYELFVPEHKPIDRLYPDGYYTWRDTPPTTVTRNPNFHLLRLTTTESDVAGLVLASNPMPTLTGEVRRLGQPAAGVKVEFVTTAGTAGGTTDANGRYLIYSPARDIAGTIRIAPEVQATTPFNNPGGIPASVGNSGNTEVSTVFHALTFTVSGRVMAGADPLAGVTVRLGSFSATTSAQGVYEIPNLVQGTWSVSATLAGYTFRATHAQVTVRTANVTDVDFEALFPLRGRVLDVTGQPTSTDDARTGLPEYAYALAGDQTVTVDANGRFEFMLPVGRHEVRVVRHGWTFHDSPRSVGHTRLGSRDVDFQAMTFTVTGRWMTADGTLPVAGAPVEYFHFPSDLSQPDNSGNGVAYPSARVSTVTDANGYYTLRNVPTGLLNARPTMPTYNGFNLTADLDRGTEWIWSYRVLRGLVTDLDTGQPVAGVKLTALRQEYTYFGQGHTRLVPVASAVTGADGRYAMIVAQSTLTGGKPAADIVTYFVSAEGQRVFSPDRVNLPKAAVDAASTADFAGSRPTYAGVTTFQGQPVANVRIYGGTDGSQLLGTSAADGSYSVRADYGPQILTFRHDTITFPSRNFFLDRNHFNVVTQGVNGPIAGRVTLRGGPFPGVLLRADSGATARTGPDGSYLFANLPGSAVTLTPELSNVAFMPASHSVALTAAGQSGLDFAAVTHEIAGNVRSGTQPVAGQTVKLIPQRLNATRRTVSWARELGTGSGPIPALTIDEAGFTRDVRVRVKATNVVGSLYLETPDGRRILLHESARRTDIYGDSIDGTYGADLTPRQSLGSIDGSSATGEWRLLDVRPPESATGKLAFAGEAWSIEFDLTPVPANLDLTATTASDGTYRFTGITNGSYQVALVSSLYRAAPIDVVVAGASVADANLAVNAPTWRDVTAFPSRAASFGTGPVLVAPAAANLTAPLTFETWVRFVGLDGQDVVFAETGASETATSRRRLAVGRRTNGGFFVEVDYREGNDSATYRTPEYVASPLQSQAWTHVAVTISPSFLVGTETRHRVKLFLNGVQTREMEVPQSRLPVFSHAWRLGGAAQGARFRGWLDGVRLWNKELTGGELGAAHATAIYPAETSGLLRQYTMEDDDPAVASDTSGQGAHATWVGGVGPARVNSDTLFVWSENAILARSVAIGVDGPTQPRLEIVQAPSAGGSLTLSPDGTQFRFAPESGFSGTVNFTLQPVVGTVRGPERIFTIQVVATQIAGWEVPATLASGSNATATLTLDSPAADGGITVTATSSDAAVIVPSLIRVPEGAISATVPLVTMALAEDRAVTLAVARPNGTRSATVGLRRSLFDVAGRVRKPDGTPLAGAVVSLGERTATSAADGAFGFTRLPAGLVSLQTSLYGYAGARVSADLRSGSATAVDVVLEPQVLAPLSGRFLKPTGAANQWLTLPALDQWLGSARGFTFSAWVRVDPATAPGAALFSAAQSSGADLVQLSLEGAGRVPTLTLGTAGAPVVLAAATGLPAGVWIHVAATFTPGSATAEEGTARLYVLGREVAAGTVVRPAAVARENFRAATGLAGGIEAMAFWNVALPIEDVRHTLFHGPGSRGDFLIADYPFDEASGGELLDRGPLRQPARWSGAAEAPRGHATAGTSLDGAPIEFELAGTTLEGAVAPFTILQGASGTLETLTPATLRYTPPTGLAAHSFGQSFVFEVASGGQRSAPRSVEVRGAPADLASLNVTPLTARSGGTFTVTLALAVPAGPGGRTYTLVERIDDGNSASQEISFAPGETTRSLTRTTTASSTPQQYFFHVFGGNSALSAGHLALPSRFVVGGTIARAGTEDDRGGVTIRLQGAAIDRSVTTVAGGAFSFSNLADGTYTVTPSAPGATFNPVSRTVTVSTADVLVPSFALVEPAIASLVLSRDTVQGGERLAATVTLSAPAPFGGQLVRFQSDLGEAVATPRTPLKIAAGATTLTADLGTALAVIPLSGKVFATAGSSTREVPLTVLATTQGVAGTVQKYSQGIGGVTLRLSTSGVTRSVISGPNGAYLFPDIAAGTYTVTPEAPFTTFYPASRTVTVTAGTPSNLEPFAVAVPAFSGVSFAPNPAASGQVVQLTISTNGPAPIGGVELALSPDLWGLPRTVVIPPGQTSATVSFTYRDRRDGGLPVVTVIDPRSGTLLGDFSFGTVPPRQAIRGVVRLRGQPLSGVAVQLVGATGVAPVTTGADGAYAFANLMPATYTVRATLTQHTFREGDRTVELFDADAEGLNFTANDPALASLVLSATNFRGARSVTATAALAGPAPRGGTTVVLATSDAAVAPVPATLIIPEGQSSASLAIAVPEVTARRFATLTATVGQTSRAAELQAGPPLAISGQVLLGADPLPNFEIMLGNSATSLRATTGADGRFVFPTIGSGTYTLGPSLGADLATPSARSVTVGDLPVGGQDFVVRLPAVAFVRPWTTEPFLRSHGRYPVRAYLDRDASSPFGVVTVTVSLDRADVSAPATITVPLGSNHAQFDLTTGELSSGGNVVVTATAGGVSQTLTVPLQADPIPIAGRVRQFGGAPTLTSSGRAVPADGGQALVGGLDADGNFSLGANRTGRYTVSVVPSDGRWSVFPADLTVDLTNGPISGLQFELTPAFPVRLEFSSATVRAGQAVTGRVYLNIPSTSVAVPIELQVDDPARATVPASVTHAVHPAAYAEFTVGTVAADTERNVTLTARVGSYSISAPLAITPATLTIAGRILQAGGEPAAGVILNLSGGASATTTTGPDGAYRFSNLTPNATYQVTPAESAPVFVPAHRTVVPGATDGARDVDFTRHAVHRTASGRITLPDGTPLNGLAVQVAGQTTESDAFGHWRIARLVPGNYPVVAAPLALGTYGGSLTANLETGDAANLNLVLSPVVAPLDLGRIARVGKVGHENLGAFGAVPDSHRTLAGAFTLEGWLRFESDFPADFRLIRLRQGSGGEIELGLEGATRRPVLLVSQGGVVSKLVAPDSAGIPSGTWVHLAGTFAPSSADAGTGRLYLNGRNVATGPLLRPHAVTTGDSRLGEAAPDAGPWSARLDEVRIWATARSAAEINSSLLAWNPGPGEAVPISRFTFDGALIDVASAPFNYPLVYHNGSAESFDPRLDSTVATVRSAAPYDPITLHLAAASLLPGELRYAIAQRIDPASGTLSEPAGDTVVYTRHPGFNGVATFAFTANAGLTISRAQPVQINVSGRPVSGVSLAASALSGIGQTTGTVTLATAGDDPVRVQLSTDAPDALQVPAEVVVPAGQTSATFTVSGRNPAATTQAFLFAHANGATRVAGVTVSRDNSVRVIAGRVTIGAGGPPFPGALVEAHAPGVYPAVASTTTGPDGGYALQVPGNTALELQARTGFRFADPVNLTATGTSVAPLIFPEPNVSHMFFSSSNNGNARTTLTAVVNIDRAAYSGGLTLALTSSNPAAATVPATVTIPAGQTSTQFSISPQLVFSQTSATITASAALADGSTSSASLSANISPVYVSVYGAILLDGVPTPNINLLLRGPNGAFENTRSFSDGSFVFENVAGGAEYTLSLNELGRSLVEGDTKIQIGFGSISGVVRNLVVPPFIPDIAGRALATRDFGGPPAELVGPRVADFTPGGAFSVELWFRSAEAIQPDAPLLEMVDTTGATPRHLLFLGFGGSTQRLSARTSNDTAGLTSLFGVSAPAIPTGQWVHAALTVGAGDGVTGPATLYLNGRPVAAGTLAVPAANASRNQRHLAGRGDGRIFRGHLDEVRLWNVERTAAQVFGSSRARTATSLPNPADPNLFFWYRFDQDTPTQLTDSSTGARHGTHLRAPEFVNLFSATVSSSAPDAPVTILLPVSHPSLLPDVRPYLASTVQTEFGQLSEVSGDTVTFTRGPAFPGSANFSYYALREGLNSPPIEIAVDGPPQRRVTNLQLAAGAMVPPGRVTATVTLSAGDTPANVRITSSIPEVVSRTFTVPAGVTSYSVDLDVLAASTQSTATLQAGVNGLAQIGNVLTLLPNGLPVQLTQPPAAQSGVVGGSATFTAAASGNPAPSLTWFRGTTFAGSGGTLTVSGLTLAQSGQQYTVRATNTLGSVTSAPVTLTVTPVPVAPAFTTQPASVTVARGQNANFTITATGTPEPAIQWLKNGLPLPGATAATLALTNVQPADDSVYHAQLSSAAGQSLSQPAALVVQVPVEIVTPPAALTVNQGQNATFTVVATGTPEPTYQWKRNGVDIPGATAASFVVASALPLYEGAYSVSVSNPQGTVLSAGATLAVNAPPIITAQPVARAVTTGASATFTVAATGKPAPTFQWRKAGMPITGATGASYTITAVTAADVGTYDVAVANPLGSVTSAAAALSLGIAPVIVVPPASQSVAAGASVTFSVTVTADPAPTYQWRRNDSALPGATNASLILAPVQLADAGAYTVVVTNSAGSAISTPATLNVVPAGAVASHLHPGFGYLAGSPVAVANSFVYATSPGSLTWQVLLPSGWTLASATGTAGANGPAPGTAGLLEWTWATPPPSPLHFTYTVNVPSGTSGPQSLAAIVLVHPEGIASRMLALPDPLVLQPAPTRHSADTDANGRLSLLELTRVIELYNTRADNVRTGRYAILANTEDGFTFDPTPNGSGAAVLDSYHSADSNRDARISLFELTRVIELYNTRTGTLRTGRYTPKADSEDGFAPAP